MSQTDQTNASVPERAVQFFQWAVLGTLATLGQTLVGETLVRLALRFDFWFGLAIGIVLVVSLLALRSESRHEQLPDVTDDERSRSTEVYSPHRDDDTEFAAEDVVWPNSPRSNEADSATDPSPSSSRPQSESESEVESESESDTDAEPGSSSQGRQQPSQGGQPHGGQPQGGQQPPQGGQPQGGHMGRPRHGSVSTASTPSTRRDRIRSFVGRQRDAFVGWFRSGRWYHYLVFLGAVGGSVVLDRTYGVSAVLLAGGVLVVALLLVEGGRRGSSSDR